MSTQKADQGTTGTRKPRLTPEERQQRRLEEYNLAANLFKMRKVQWPTVPADVQEWVKTAMASGGKDIPQELIDHIGGLVMQAIPLHDYVEFPTAPMRPGVVAHIGISATTIQKWITNNTLLAGTIARARGLAADTLAERMLSLAGLAVESPLHAQACRVGADILRWQAAVRAPAKYGERMQVTAPEGTSFQISIGTPVTQTKPEVTPVNEHPRITNPNSTPAQAGTPGGEQTEPGRTAA